jgi:hypothetical protein
MGKRDEPAFPVMEPFEKFNDETGTYVEYHAPVDGLSKREYFAGLAMQGMQQDTMYDAGRATPEQRARLAVIEADALLAALEKSE